MRICLPTRALGRAVAAAAATATLVAVSTGPVSAGTTDGPGYQQPTVGECRDLDMTQGAQKSNGTAPIDCASAHTTRVIAVGRLPRGLGWDAAPARLDSASARVCLPALDAALGGTASLRDMSAYSALWFIPNKVQRAHGARWFRCDLALLGGTRLLPLPTDETPALDASPLPDSVARCLTARNFYRTTCARTHAFRATGTFRMRQDAFPTQRQFDAAVVKRCPALVSSAAWRWSARGKDAWKLGDHTVVCYSKTQD